MNYRIKIIGSPWSWYWLLFGKRGTFLARSKAYGTARGAESSALSLYDAINRTDSRCNIPRWED